MKIYTVYRNTLDYPGKIVVRGALIGPGTITMDEEPLYVGESIHEAREAIERFAPHAHRAARDVNDDPVIAEIWL
jgi:hypothetical protein